VIEGYDGAARERIYQYVAFTRNSSSGNQMIREPAAPPSPQIVVPNPIAAGGRVNEAAVSRINRHVADPATLGKKH